MLTRHPRDHTFHLCASCCAALRLITHSTSTCHSEKFRGSWEECASQISAPHHYRLKQCRHAPPEFPVCLPYRVRCEGLLKR